MMKKEKKAIIRRCASCKIEFDREELIKITKLNDGTLKINPALKELGRSLYVCKNPECIKVLIKKKRLKTGLKCSNNLEIERVERELTKLLQNPTH